MGLDPTFWLHRRVLVTGHTGFKGSWLALYLHHLGAEVQGFALPADHARRLFELAGVADFAPGGEGDVRDRRALEDVVESFRPEIVLHLAGQPLVGDALKDPVRTFEINTLGTLNLLHAAHRSPDLRAVVVITSDKVYREPSSPCAEGAPLGGAEPYAASKAAAELVVDAFRHCYLTAEDGIGLATARAGNVIGAGDFSPGRLVPDLVRGLSAGREVVLRHPGHVRPWQHVLDAVGGYLILAQALARNPQRFAGAWNFGPDGDDATATVADLAERFISVWGGGSWRTHTPGAAHEQPVQRLSAARARESLGWRPLLRLGTAIEWTVEGYKSLLGTSDRAWLDRQLRTHLGLAWRNWPAERTAAQQGEALHAVA